MYWIFLLQAPFLPWQSTIGLQNQKGGKNDKQLLLGPPHQSSMSVKFNCVSVCRSDYIRGIDSHPWQWQQWPCQQLTTTTTDDSIPKSIPSGPDVCFENNGLSYCINISSNSQLAWINSLPKKKQKYRQDFFFWWDRKKEKRCSHIRDVSLWMTSWNKIWPTLGTWMWFEFAAPYSAAKSRGMERRRRETLELSSSERK